MARVVITEFMDEVVVEGLAEDFDTVYDPSLADRPDRILGLLGDAEALVVRNRTIVDAAMLDAAPRLRIVGRLGVGLDNIDVAACAQRGVPVLAATGANVEAVAEYVITVALMLVRGSFLMSSRVAAGEWPRAALTGRELSGRTLGLVGFGAIARRVAEIAETLGMRVIAYDPFLPGDDPAWASASSVDLPTLVARSDVLSLHVPLTDATRDLISASEIDSMPDDAVLINTARGGVVDEGAVIAALRSGRLAGAALDVFASEPVDATSGAVFADVPNLILTPHIAGITHESNSRVSSMIASAVRTALGAPP
ncbi:MAG: hydroxyacid dehydrogenase [Acidimicrobiia bacterium]